MTAIGPKPAPGHGALYGTQWQPRDIARVLWQAGIEDVLDLTTGVMVTLAESDGYDHAIHVNLDGSEDRGMFQLNSIHKAITDEIAYDPEKAADFVFDLYASAGQKFTDWAAYTSKVYLDDRYLGRAVIGVANFVGDMMLNRPPRETAPVRRFKTPVANYQHRVGEQLAHVDRAHEILGWGSKSADTVLKVQQEISKAHTAAKASYPST